MKSLKDEKKPDSERKMVASSSSSSSSFSIGRADDKLYGNTDEREAIVGDHNEDSDSDRFFDVDVLDGQSTAATHYAEKAPAKEGGSSQKDELVWLPFEIPEYPASSRQDDAEGIDYNQYSMRTLQIDESLFGKQKYHRGHLVKGAWVVGVREFGQGADGRKIRLEVVPNRTTTTLMGFIKRYVRAGSWLHHDYWKGYPDGTMGTKDLLGAIGIKGLAVNHDVGFTEWHPKHRKVACTNTIEGEWVNVILKTPKRHYTYSMITPHLREVEWDRQHEHDPWGDWWVAFQGVTPAMVAEWKDHLADIAATNPHLPKETHPLLKANPRGFYGGKGGSRRDTRNKFHYAYCGTANPKRHGCVKCDFYWGQFGIFEREARKATFKDEKESIASKRFRLARVIEKLEKLDQESRVDEAKQSLDRALAYVYGDLEDESDGDFTGEVRHEFSDEEVEESEAEVEDDESLEI